ncbi:MAG TPA: helix-turn-helix domain-containing protein [Chitinophagales bacterium]|nr:helix-turn-helix domain-containing protein [Chitinophagales bacterium]
MTRVIKTEREYRKALERIYRLMNTARKNTEAGDELELLALLIEKYEETHYAIPSPDPVEFLEYVMNEKGLHQSDLVKYIGSKSSVSQIMNRKRSLTVEMIRKLSKGLKIPVEGLVGV